MKIQLKQIKIAWLTVTLLLSAVAYAQETGSISGRVVTEEGKPLANFNVSLFAGGGDRSRGISRSTTTDEDGNFQFNRLPNRIYNVSPSIQKGYVLTSPARLGGLRPGENVTITMTRGGVITGRVTDSNGEPLVNMSVAAYFVRDQQDRKINASGSGPPRTTDDRGIYRLYGLQPGTYLVVANGGQSVISPAMSPYHGETPTFHPSSTRDTAAEVKVTSGGEATGIDIRYRAEPGRTVSGKVSGGGESTAPNYGANVTLRQAQTGVMVGSAYVAQSLGVASFAIQGVPDGEYELAAQRGSTESEEYFYSEARRIKVQGTDAAGIELRLIPAASVAGRLTIEKSPGACDARLKASLEDTFVTALMDEKVLPNAPLTFRTLTRGDSPDEKGEFKINGLMPGRYRLNAGLREETWFLKSISAPLPNNSGGKPATVKPVINDLSRAGLPLKPGEKFAGVIIVATDGGASLHGKVAAKEGTKLPSRLQVHLVPAEAAAADDVLRYAERRVGDNGSFAIPNLAPGKYWLLTRALPENDQPERPKPLSHWDTTERARLRKEAETAKHEIELKPCQRIKDHVLPNQM